MTKHNEVEGVKAMMADAMEAAKRNPLPKPPVHPNCRGTTMYATKEQIEHYLIHMPHFESREQAELWLQSADAYLKAVHRRVNEYLDAR